MEQNKNKFRGYKETSTWNIRLNILKFISFTKKDITLSLSELGTDLSGNETLNSEGVLMDLQQWNHVIQTLFYAWFKYGYWTPLLFFLLRMPHFSLKY